MNLSITDNLIVFVLALVTFLIIDLGWLGVVAKDFYRRHLKKFLVKKFDWRPAIIFYTIFIVGLMFFAIIPAINAESLGIAMGRGLAYGFFTYATYDLTNLSTLNSWPKKIVVVDILWGSFLAWSVATITYSLFFVFTA